MRRTNVAADSGSRLVNTRLPSLAAELRVRLPMRRVTNIDKKHFEGEVLLKKAIVLIIVVISLISVKEINILGNSTLVSGIVSQADWENVSPEDEIFTVKMPSAPTKKISEQETQVGKLPQRIYELKTKYGDYLVGVTEFPQPISPNDTPKVFESGKDGLIRYKGYKLINEKEIAFSNYPGKELFLEAPGQPPTVCKTRTYLIGQQLIQLIVIQPKTDSYPKSTIDYYNSLTNRFFSSLQIKKVQ